jgi:peptidoglycan/LPS O-acetylase OafA/YrhL
VLTQQHCTTSELTRILGAPGPANAAYVAANLGITLSASLLTWHFLEQPMLSFKRHFSYRSPQRAALRATPSLPLGPDLPRTEAQ